MSKKSPQYGAYYRNAFVKYVGCQLPGPYDWTSPHRYLEPGDILQVLDCFDVYPSRRGATVEDCRYYEVTVVGLQTFSAIWWWNSFWVPGNTICFWPHTQMLSVDIAPGFIRRPTPGDDP